MMDHYRENGYRTFVNESVLLLDETIIEQESGIIRQVQPGKKRPFVMEPDRDKSWEYCGPGMTKLIHLYGTTLYDELTATYRMWYMSRMGPHWRLPHGNYQVPGLYIPRTDERPYNCNGVTQDKYGRAFVDNDRGDLTLYAESDDGIHWVKPKLGVLYVTAEQIPGEKNQMPCDGPIDSQFVYSRDGTHWGHADRARTAVIERGAADAFDRGMIIGTAKEPIIEGDEVHWYYTGCEHTHGEVDMDKRIKRLGRATWQRDRFVALKTEDEGIVVTKALFRSEGITGLEVNANATGGQIVAELCNADGRVLEGFSRAECVPLQRDDLRWQVTWKAGELANVQGAVKIRFFLNRSALYSFTFRK